VTGITEYYTVQIIVGYGNVNHFIQWLSCRV
jgi:hypothetical protein